MLLQWTTGLTLLLVTIPMARCRPNFVLFIADDLGYGDLSCYGHPSQEQGPIDVMAREGMRFTQMYAAASVCTPSRAAILTGRQPFRSGLVGPGLVAMPNQAVGLDHDEITVAEVLKKQGYRTGFVGKWHQGINRMTSTDGYFLPQNQGFDFVGSFLPFTLVTQCDTSKEFMATPLKELCFLYKNNSVIQQPLNIDQLSEIFLNDAKAFLYDSWSRPFFLLVSLAQTHTPMHSSPRYRGSSRRGSYGDEINEMGWVVGKVLDTLKSLGVGDNTLTVFVSDHGPHLELCYWSGHSGPFSGGKAGIHEGGFRVPAIFHWPGVIHPGVVSQAVASLMDLFPTFVELAGGDLPTVKRLDGRSLTDVLLYNKPSPHSVLFLYDSLRDSLVAARYGKYKIYFVKQAAPTAEDYTRHCNTRGTPRKDWYFAMGSKTRKLKVPVIYNVEADPSEILELSSSDHVDVLKEVIVLLEEEKQTWPDRKEMQLIRRDLHYRLIPCCNPPFCTCNYYKNPHTWAQCEK